MRSRHARRMPAEPSTAVQASPYSAGPSSTSTSGPDRGGTAIGEAGCDVVELGRAPVGAVGPVARGEAPLEVVVRRQAPADLGVRLLILARVDGLGGADLRGTGG